MALRFELETVAIGGVGQEFEGDIASQSRVAGLENFTHAAGSQGGNDFVRTTSPGANDIK